MQLLKASLFFGGADSDDEIIKRERKRQPYTSGETQPKENNKISLFSNYLKVFANMVAICCEVKL